jgi:hypothetical protein
VDRVLVLPFLFTTSLVAAPADDGWISIFNGQTLDGWTVKGLPVKITNTRIAETATGGIYYIPETWQTVGL